MNKVAIHIQYLLIIKNVYNLYEIVIKSKESKKGI